MTLNFPNTAVAGTTYVGDNGVTYTYDGIKWVAAGGGGALVPVPELTSGNIQLVLNTDGTVQFPGYLFPATDGSNGQVLTTDGLGLLSWNNGGNGPKGDPGLVWQGTWNPSGSYIANTDVVAYNGGSYIKIGGDGNSGSAPPDDLVRWAVVAASGAGSPTDRLTNGDFNVILNSNGTISLPTITKLNSGGLGVTNSAEFGTETYNNGEEITSSQIYMGAGHAEARAIVDSGGNSLMYLGVEDPGFAGIVAIDPAVSSEYNIRVGINGQIELSKVVGQFTTEGYTVGIGVLNGSANINGLYADPDKVVVATDSQGWIFRNDAVLQLPLGGDIVNHSNISLLNQNGPRLVNGDYEVVLEDNGTLTLPGNIILGNLNDNDVVLWAPANKEYAGLWWGGENTEQNYGPDVSVTAGAGAVEDPGYGQYDPQVHLKVYEKHWSFKRDGTIVRENGDRVAMYRELPRDVSDLSDRNSLLASNSAASAINIDGGGAYVVFEQIAAADGGFSSSRYGRASTVFDGGPRSTTNTFELTLDGGGA